MPLDRGAPDLRGNGWFGMPQLRNPSDSPAPLRVRRAPSRVQALGQWLALTLVVATTIALLRINTDALFAWPPSRIAWNAAATNWFGILAGVGVVTLALTVLPRLLPAPILLRWPLLALAALCAGALGSLLQRWWVSSAVGKVTPAAWNYVNLHTLIVLSALLAVVFEAQRRSRQADDAMYQSEIDRGRLQAELAAGRLQVLQAQVEPHFLFNSLANVRRLLRTDGAAGRAMLADMLLYLESALPRLRDENPTLGREMELARAYLAVHQVRMGGRLQVAFEVPPSLLGHRLPPMMLLTLVENAIKHGIAPLVEGGTILISASGEVGGRISVSVADDGRGVDAGVGHGTGLANIRARLKAAHGDRAALRFMVNVPRGVVATLELPAMA